MESHHDGDETKGFVYPFVQDYIEVREASNILTAGPKDLTVTVRGLSISYVCVCVCVCCC